MCTNTVINTNKCMSYKYCYKYNNITNCKRRILYKET